MVLRFSTIKSLPRYTFLKRLSRPPPAPLYNTYLERFLPCCFGRGHRAPQAGGVVLQHGRVFVALRGRWALLIGPDLGRQELESLKSGRQRYRISSVDIYPATNTLIHEGMNTVN